MFPWRLAQLLCHQESGFSVSKRGPAKGAVGSGRSLAGHKTLLGAEADAQLVSALPSLYRAMGSLHSMSVIPALVLWRQGDEYEVKSFVVI